MTVWKSLQDLVVANNVLFLFKMVKTQKCWVLPVPTVSWVKRWRLDKLLPKGKSPLPPPKKKKQNENYSVWQVLTTNTFLFTKLDVWCLEHARANCAFSFHFISGTAKWQVDHLPTLSVLSLIAVKKRFVNSYLFSRKSTSVFCVFNLHWMTGSWVFASNWRRWRCILNVHTAFLV